MKKLLVLSTAAGGSSRFYRLDLDVDGAANSQDNCPNTPAGTQVGAKRM